MKSFRAERQRRNASLQVTLTLMVLLVTILMARFLPGDVTKTAPATKSAWESSVVKQP